MTDDLVERLREEAADWDEPKHSDEVDVRGMLHNAADRIAALIAAGDKLAGFAGHDEQCACWDKGYSACDCGYTEAMKAWSAALGDTQ